MLPFRQGSAVEVCSTEEGFGGVCFEAVLIKPPVSSKAGYCALVEYKTLLSSPNKKRQYENAPTSRGRSKPVREFVGISDLRPQPPKEAQQFFEINEIVDAFKEDGWWTGVINAVLADSSYCVLFQNPPDQLRFTADKLRPHVDWIDGRWIRPNKKGIQELISIAGAKIEVIPFGESSNNFWVPAIVLKNDGGSQIVVRYQSSGNCYVADCVKGVADIHNIRPRPPSLHKHKYFYLENVDAVTDSCWRSGFINRDLRHQKYVVLFRNDLLSMDFTCSELRPHLDWTDGKWFCGESLLIASQYREQARTGRKNINSGELILQIEFSGTEGGKTPSSVISAKNQTERSTVYDVRSPSSDETSGKKRLDYDTSLLRPASAKKLKNDGSMSPSLCSNYSSHAPESLTLVGPIPENKIESVDNGVKSAKNHPCGLPQNPTVKCPLDPSIGFVANEQESVPDVDHPHLSMRVEDVHPLKRSGPCATPAVNRRQEIRDDVYLGNKTKDVDVVMQVPAVAPVEMVADASQVNMTNDVAPTTVGASEEPPQSGLCFVKVSPIWEMLEAMEPFKSVPQDPHFSPLLQYQEEVREGLAIANMVTFVNLMKNSSELKVCDPGSSFDGMLKAADALVSFGFDVEILQRRLHDLLMLKSKWVRLVDAEGVPNETKMDIICGEICEIKKQLRELEEKLEHALTRKAALEMEMDQIRQVESDFVARAAV